MNNKRKHTHIYLLALLLSMVLLPACTTTKNTGWTRFYQSLTTRYNIYFNAEQNYIEQLKLQQDKYEDNFTDLIYVLLPRHTPTRKILSLKARSIAP